MPETPTNQPIQVSVPDTPKLTSKFIKRKINVIFSIDDSEDNMISFKQIKNGISPLKCRKLDFN